MEDRLTTKTILVAGIVLAIFGLSLILILFYFDSNFAIKILSMIGACHIGGRLAFIGTGYELELTILPIIIIIIFYNTAYLLIVYSLFVLLSEKTERFKFFKSLHEKIQNSKKLRSKWNLVSIAIFIWIPLPMTGAAVGSLLAYLEGYNSRATIMTAVPSMWVGVISWTLAFDELYFILKMLNPNVTIILTLFLVISPFIYNLVLKRNRNTEKNH